ncbi:thioredoxin family protein [Leptothrix sp. BB-4]
MTTPGRAGRRFACLAAMLVLIGLPARAALPAPYAPIVVEPTQQDGNRLEFDLRPAQAQARAKGKWLFVYLGASDCPFCRRYEAFLSAHATELLPHFREKYLVVDLRSQLSVTAARMILRSDRHRLPYADFQRAIGDQRARMLVYPSVWLLDPDGQPLMQMPAGTGTFETVDEQLEVLRLEN